MSSETTTEINEKMEESILKKILKGEVTNNILPDEILNDFDDPKVNLNEDLLRGIYGHGFEKPSYAQTNGIISGIKGNDIVFQAKSGQGKTATYVITILQLLSKELEKKPNEHYVRYLILEPTKELAQQTFKTVKALSSFMDNVNAYLCLGETNVRDMIHDLRNNSYDIIVGTPGRTLHMCEEFRRMRSKPRNAFDQRDVRFIALDEADQLFEKGFKSQIQGILEHSHETVQIGLYSATVPDECLELLHKMNFLRHPKVSLLPKDDLTLAGLRQYGVAVRDDEDKLDCLLDLYASRDIPMSVIFTNKRDRASKLNKFLIEKGFSITTIHSGMSAAERASCLAEFESSARRVLIGTDLVARGIDIKGIKLVINFDFPHNTESYIHRIGRCARFGSKGTSISFITESDREFVRRVENNYRTVIDELPMDFEV